MGIAGRVARSFLRSKLTPLVAIASLAVGALAIIATPREEEPQISVPMIDVIASMPGATPRETENLLARPIERRMWEIPGVEYVYSTAGDGMALVTVRFRVGADPERSVTGVQAKLFAAADQLPPGALPPIVKPHGIDDVPILTLTLHGGAGYLPLSITGLKSPTGHTLTVNGTPVDQHIRGNDFWQTDFDPATKTYTLTYNLPADTADALHIELTTSK